MSKEQKDKGVIMSKKYDYLVVGAGLYGAVFAHEAKEAGKSVLVIDKRPNIAGSGKLRRNRFPLVTSKLLRT